MNAAPLLLAPLALTGGTAVAAMLVIGAYRHHALTAVVTVTGLICALVTVAWAWNAPSGSYGPLLVLDQYALFFQTLFLLTAVALIALSYAYFDRAERHREEFYVLLVLATLGAMVLAASAHFVSFFLGLELLSVSLYALIAFCRNRALGLEAAIRYLILAAVSSAFLLLGMALLYAERGTMSLPAQAAMSPPLTMTFLAGLSLILVAVGFKLALVPFHLWTPDVYRGAPAPVAAFIATVSKASVLALLVRTVTLLNLTAAPAMVALICGAAVLSMLAGNLLALREANLKRLLAYSSIAHMGYVLLAAVLSGPTATLVAGFYLVTYVLAILVAFGVITVLSDGTGEPEMIANWAGLSQRRPWLAAALTAALLSLAGLPLTAGFLGKFVLVSGGVVAHLWWPLGALVVGSVLSLYYYLRVISTLYSGTSQPESSPASSPPGDAVAAAALAVLAVLIVALGVYPAPLLALLADLASHLAH